MYVLTDKCKEDCNKQTKFMETKKLAGADDLMSRIEYGYGSGYINGFVNEQPICFSNDSMAPCINGVKILEADQATGVSNDRFAGIIGLSPRSTETNLQAFLSQVQQINAQSQHDQLSPLFSFYLSSNPSQDGMVTFGGYDVKKYGKEGAKDSDIFWGKAMPGEKFWTMRLNSIALTKGEQKSDLSQYTPKYAILDTGMSYALVPQKDFEKLLTEMSNFGVSCVQPKDQDLVSTHTCTCKDYNALPDIQFDFSSTPGQNEGPSKALKLPKESYMEKVGGNGCGSFRLTPNTISFGNQQQSSYWVLGAIFLQNYYSIYDFKNMKVGLIEASTQADGNGWSL